MKTLYCFIYWDERDAHLAVDAVCDMVSPPPFISFDERMGRVKLVLRSQDGGEIVLELHTPFDDLLLPHIPSLPR